MGQELFRVTPDRNLEVRDRSYSKRTQRERGSQEIHRNSILNKI